jgi:hypothetical protein
MNLKLKTTSLSLNPEVPFSQLQNEMQSLFNILDDWQEDNLMSVAGIMHSLTFPKAGVLSASSKINEILAEEYRKRHWPVIGGDTSGGQDLVITVTLVGYENQ